MKMIIWFSVGSSTGRKRLRLVVGAEYAEQTSTDQLGAPSWIPIGWSGLPPRSKVLERALAKFIEEPADLLARVREKLYPKDVSKTDRGLEVEVGDLTAICERT